MDRNDQLQALKSKAQDLKTRLQLLNRRINEIQMHSRTFFLQANVDSDKCVGCGTCEALCPVGAITVGDIAQIDEDRCVGCGYCIHECPKGALFLHPVGFSYKRQYERKASRRSTHG